MSQETHPYHNLHLPPSAPFTLLPSPDKNKGWGVFATKPISRGTLILSEHPLFIIPKPSETITNRDILTSFQTLTPASREQCSHLLNNGTSPFTHPHHLDLFEQNSFESRSSSSGFTGPPRKGFYILSSRYNHSCVPNAHITPHDDDILRMCATQDIATGEEITFCYLPDFHALSRAERHYRLGFNCPCDCKACLVGTSFWEVSELRRRLLRGLQYMILGVDLDGKERNPTTLIIDPIIRGLAEENNLPLSAIFVMNLLSVCLIEAEGLLDDLMIAMLEPYIKRLATTFKTARNARVAKRVMRQPTWQGKFWVALGLWKEFDEADYGIGVMRIMEGFRGLDFRI